jgi:hypothetical protein
MMIFQFLLPLFTIFIIVVTQDDSISKTTTATLLDFDGYERYNASIIAADKTATTYYLAGAPQ